MNFEGYTIEDWLKVKTLLKKVDEKKRQYLKKCWKNTLEVYNYLLQSLLMEYQDYLDNPNRKDNINRSECVTRLEFINKKNKYNYDKLVSYYERKSYRLFKAFADDEVDFFTISNKNNQPVYIPVLKEALVQLFENNEDVYFKYGEDIVYLSSSIENIKKNTKK